MTVHKQYTNKQKSHFTWYFVVDLPPKEFDEYGRPKRNQKRKCGFAKKSDAEKAEREFLQAYQDNKVELNTSDTVHDVLTNFITFTENEGNYEEGTICNYKGYLNNHMESLKKVPVKNLTPTLIQNWKRELYQKGASSHIFNGCLKLAKRAFNFAINLQQISVNPFDAFKPDKIEKKIRKRFSIDEFKILLDICKKHLPDYYPIFCISTMTGMRLGEYSALKVCDIDRKAKRINVIERQFTRNVVKNELKTKTSRRSVILSDELLAILDWHIQDKNLKEDDFLFYSGNKPVRAKFVERRFAKLLTLAGYDEKYCRVHDLRGQYVDFMHLCGISTELISRQVGHSSSVITSKVYTEILSDLPIEANRKLDNLLFA